MPRRSTRPADYQRVPRPIAAMAKNFRDGWHVHPHSHERAQLLYASEGVMRVATANGAWVVPPQRAVWVPPGVVHEIRMSGPVSMRTLYIDPGLPLRMPDDCAVIEVSPLLRELILAAVEEPVEYDEAGRGGKIAALILDEIEATRQAPLHLPMPRDRRLVRICQALLANPADARTLERWAEAAGASGRTLARLFRRETGMTFALWRQQSRVAAALPLLAQGEAVGLAARAVGYGSPSAFTAMFRRLLGATPDRYFRVSRRTPAAR